jgi:hypothetical protein
VVLSLPILVELDFTRVQLISVDCCGFTMSFAHRFDSMSIIMDMCERFATKDDVQSSISMVVADTSGARLAGLENVCDEVSRRLHLLEKSKQTEGNGLAVRSDCSNSYCAVFLCTRHLLWQLRNVGRRRESRQYNLLVQCWPYSHRSTR